MIHLYWICSKTFSSRKHFGTLLTGEIRIAKFYTEVFVMSKHSGRWPHTVTPSIDRTLHQFFDHYWSRPYYRIWLLPNCARFPQNICNGCGMPIEDAYSSGYLVLSHFGTCMCSTVETTLSWTCLVSGLLNFEYPLVLLFCLMTKLNLPDSSLYMFLLREIVLSQQYSRKNRDMVKYSSFCTFT